MTDKEQIKLVVSFLKKPELRGYARKLGYDEALQEGFVGFLEGMKNYDPAKGTISTKTWKSVFGKVTLACFNRLHVRIPQYLLENTDKLKKRRMARYIEHSQEVRNWKQHQIGGGFDHAAESQTEIEIQEESEHNEWLVNIIMGMVTENEKMILKNLYGIETEEKSVKEIAEEIGIRYESAHNIKTRVIKRLQYTLKTEDAFSGPIPEANHLKNGRPKNVLKYKGMSDLSRRVFGYAVVIANHGIGSREAIEMREKHYRSKRFLEYANALDIAKRDLDSKTSIGRCATKKTHQGEGGAFD